MDSLVSGEIMRSVGFGIGCWIGLLWLNVKRMKEEEEMLEGMKEGLKEKSKGMELVMGKMDK